MRKEKILIVHPTLCNGGAEKIIAFLANILSDTYDVYLLLLKEAEITLSIDPKIKLMVSNCYYDNPIISKNLIAGINSVHNMIRKIKAHINNIEPKIVICFDLRVLFAVNFAVGKNSQKILFSERADPFENPKYWQIILKQIYKKIGHIVFQTKEAQNFYGKDIEKKSSIIHNPAISRNFVESSVKIEKRDKIIFSAGRLQYRKGFDLLIRAFAEVSKTYPEHRLRIYGSGEEMVSLKKIVSELNVISKVEFLKPINNVIEENINSELFVLPSRSEGIPNILIEAMLAEIPCVSADCSPGGARLLSDNGKFCLLANNNDNNSLAEKMLYALDNTEYMCQMSDLAKKSLSRFDTGKISEEWKNVIKRFLESE